MSHSNHENTNQETLPSPEILASLGSGALSNEVLDAVLVENYLPGVEGGAKEVASVLDGQATLVVGAEVTGPWHYSHGRLEEFSKEGAEASRCKLGTGTYFGVGDLTGETVDGLKSDGSIRHEISFSGNVLVVDRERVVEVSKSLDKMKGRPVSRLRMPIAPIADRASGAVFGGHSVQAVMVYMDPERTSGEMIVLPHAVDGIRVLK
jgi:hypothetical protein